MPNILPLEGAPLPRLQDPQVGHLELDLGLGDFTIIPGPAGEPIRVEADYDKRLFDLREELIQNDDGAWTYRVKYGSRGGWLGLMLRGGGNNPKSRMTIVVPRDQPLDLSGFVGLGKTQIDLGGLWLRNVDLELGTGNHTIDFSEPLPQPMESLRIEKEVGELKIRSLGNASPTEVDVDQKVGGMRVDLTGGVWRGDAKIDLDIGVGNCRLSMPEDGVRIEIEKAGVGLGERRVRHAKVEELPENAPTLTIRATGNIGEVRVD